MADGALNILNMQALQGSAARICSPVVSSRRSCVGRGLQGTVKCSLQQSVPACHSQKTGIFAATASRQQLSSRRSAVRVNAKAGSVEYKDLMAIAEEACRRGEQVRGRMLTLPLIMVLDVCKSSGIYKCRSSEKLLTNPVRSLIRVQLTWSLTLTRGARRLSLG